MLRKTLIIILAATIILLALWQFVIYATPVLNPQFNVILLGLDPRDDELEKTSTTDTIIFASLNLDTTNLSLFSLPRDLWLTDQKFKINNLYPTSLQSNSSPYKYLTAQFSALLNQRIDGIVVINTQSLTKLVNIVGGVDVFLNQPLVDKSYPNPAYIASPSAKVPIYITIQYPQGLNHLNSDNIIPFVRSRKSSDLVSQGGTDLGRIARQQQLIEAVIKKISNPSFYRHPQNITRLFDFYRHEIQTNITDSLLSSILFQLKFQIFNFHLARFQLPIGDNSQTGVIYHPDFLVEGQWVFLPTGQNYSKIQQYINQNLQ